MKTNVESLPIAHEALGEMVRGQDYGGTTSAYMQYPAGLDFAPLLQGLERDHCQCPHWGYVIKGAITAIYTGGEEETARTGDLFYWPPGHTVKVNKDAEVILFSPQHEHTAVMDHVNRKLGA